MLYIWSDKEVCHASQTRINTGFAEFCSWLIGLQLEVMKMDANKFGCFVAERRKELKMTQKDLAAKIQVTDKAVSKWERGLGFPDINTIEYLADALDVSIIELMKSERETENVAIDEAVVVNVLDMAEKDVQKKQTRILIILSVTTFLCALVEMLQSIDWNARELTMSFTIPYTAIIPGFVTIIVSIIYKLKGEKTDNFIAVGICMMIIPIILSMGVFLVLGLLAG